MVGRHSRKSRSSREDLLDVREWLGSPPGCPEGHLGCPGVVWWPSRMSGSGREALPHVREWSGCPSGCQIVVGRPSRMSGVVMIPSRMSEKTSWMSGRTSRMSRSSWEDLTDVQEWSGVPPECAAVVLIHYRMSGRTPQMTERTSRMSGRGREALPDVREWSGGPSGCPRVVGRHSRMSESGREAQLDVRRVVLIPSQMAGRTSRMPG